MQEQEAIRQCQAGSLTALGVLFEMHHQAVFRTAYGVTLRRDEADDVTQDVFIELFTAIKRYDLKRPFFPWLHRIAVRRSLDKIKKRKDHAPIDVINDHPSPDPSPEDKAIESAQRAAIWAEVWNLDGKHRAVVVLFYYHGFSVAEIAKALGCPRGTVRRRLYYARAHLRELLPPTDSGLGDPMPKPPPASSGPGLASPKLFRNGKEETKDLVEDTFVAGLC